MNAPRIAQYANVDRATIAFAQLRLLGGDTCLVHNPDGTVAYRVQHRLFDDREAAANAAERGCLELVR